MSEKKRFITLAIAFTMLLTGLSSCYPMPREGEYSLVPATNNPDVVGKKGAQNWTPGAGF